MNEAIQVNLAEVKGKIVVRNRELRKRLSNLFVSYRTSEEPDFEIIIDGFYRDLKNGSVYGYPVLIEATGDQLEIFEKRNNKNIHLGIINPYLKICSLRLNEYFSYSNIVSAIRACFHFFLEQQSGFLLHASCGVVEGKAVVFTGKANSGKTTALRNIRPEKIITEDVLAIRFDDQSVRAYSIPFQKETRAQAEVQAIIFPKKFTGHPHLEKESLTNSLTEVISNTMFSAPKNNRFVSRTLGNILKFCTLIPTFNLYFPRNANLKRLFDNPLSPDKNFRGQAPQNCSRNGVVGQPLKDLIFSDELSSL